MRLISAVSISSALFLAACQTTDGPSTVTGACKSVPEPKFAYQGKAREDQRYIDKSIAFGVKVCGYPPPMPRPSHWDGQTHTVGGKTVPVPIPQKPHRATFRERFGIWQKPKPAQASAPMVIAPRI